MVSLFNGPGSIRAVLADFTGALCVFAIPYAFGLMCWAFN